MIHNLHRTYISKGTFAIDIQYQGKEFYALVIPEPPGEGSFDYHVMIPGLLNFKLGFFQNAWQVVEGDNIDHELINVVGNEISFVSTID